MRRLLAIYDNNDAHGVSTGLYQFLASYKIGKFDVATWPAYIADFTSGTILRLRKSIISNAPDYLVITDIPVDAFDPDKWLASASTLVSTLKKANKDAIAIYLDHHPSSEKHKDKLSKIFDITAITTGAGMSAFLYQLHNSGDPDEAKEFIDVDVIDLYHMMDYWEHILLAGNVADVDCSVLEPISKYPEIENRLRRMALGLHYGIVRWAEAFKMRVAMALAMGQEAFEITLMPPTDNPAEIFADIMASYIIDRKDSVALLDGTSDDVAKAFDAGWGNKAVEVLMWKKDIRVLVMPSYYYNPYSGSYEATIKVYGKCGEDLMSKLRDLPFNAEAVYGHKTFVNIVLKRGSTPEEVKRAIPPDELKNLALKVEKLVL